MEEPKTIRVLDKIRYVINVILLIPFRLLAILCAILMIVLTLLMRVLHHIIAYGRHVATGEKYRSIRETLNESWRSAMESLYDIYRPN